MIAAVHALTGATFARLCRSRTQAALVGALSHFVEDMLPHRDLDISKEAALLAGALSLIAAARGVESREFAGALGAVLPDVENVAGRVFGIPEEELFLPNHRGCHGAKTRTFHTQIAIAAIGFASLFLPESEPRTAGER